MADQVVLTSIDIDVNKAVKNISELREEEMRLKESTLELKKSQGETSAEYIQSAAQLKALQGELRSQENVLTKVVAANKANTGSIAQMRAELATVSDAWAKLSEEERMNSEEGQKLRERKKQLSDAIREERVATGDATANVGRYGDLIGALPGPIGQTTSSISGMTKAAKLFIANPFGAILAAIVLVVTALVNIFKAFDPIVDKIQQKIAALGAIFSVLKETVVALFTRQKSLNESFQGLGESMRNAAIEAERLKRAEQELDDMHLKLTVSQAAAKRQIDELLLQSKDRTKSEQERIKLIDEALQIEQTAYLERKAIADRELKIVQDKIINEHMLTELQAKQLRALGVDYAIFLKDTKAITDEEVKSLGDALAAQESILNDSIQIREKAINRQNALEEAAKEKAVKREKETAEEMKEIHRLAAEQKVNEARAELELFLMLNKEKEGIETGLLEAKDDRDKQMQARRLEQIKLNHENELALLEGTLFGELELQRIALDEQYKMEMDTANRIGADTTLVDKKYSKAKKAIATAERDAKLALANDFLQNVKQAAGEGTAVGKAAAVAITTIETYKAATSAYSSLSGIPIVGPALGAIAAAAAVAAGLANVKKILAVKSGLPGEGSVSASGVGGSASTPPVMSTVNPEIGAGIVSRESGTASTTQTGVQSTVLVVDQVTAAQNTQASQQVTASL